jgi:hypothetical protein
MVHGIPQDEHRVDGGLSHLSTCTDDCSVVVLDELQKFRLLWVWVKGDKTIFQRHNLEILAAEIQNIVLALLDFPCPFLELLWSQYFLLASLLD